MKLTHDHRADAAHLSLHEADETVTSAHSIPVTPPNARDASSHLVLDFDVAGHLIGIEFLSPQDQLLPSVLKHAKVH